MNPASGQSRPPNLEICASAAFAIDATNLHKAVPVGFLGTPRTLLNGMTLRVREGEIHGLVGRNGAGKSTLMRALLGATPVQQGTVLLWGRDPGESVARADVGYAPDIALFPPTLTPREIVRMHTALLGPSDQGGMEVLKQVGLLTHVDRPVRVFSKGMSQRLSLAVALLGTPRLLILDEPMSGLDPEGRHLVRQLILRSHAAGVTILFSSHVLTDVEELCSSATIIDGGRTLATGSVREMTAGDGGFTLTYRCRDAVTFSARLSPEALDSEGLWQARLATATELTNALMTLNALSQAEVLSIQSNRRGFDDYLHDLLASGVHHQSEAK